MLNDFIYDEMIKLDADGVDFVPICVDFNQKFPPVIKSFTKEEWLSVNCILKTGRRYWKFNEEGKKEYIQYL